MEKDEVKSILESVIFVSPSPVKLETLLEVLPESNKELILEDIRRIKEECEPPTRGIELVEVAGGYQFRTKPRYAEWVARLKKAKTVKFSQSALETMAIVAYRQPVIRPQIEEIRGVDSGWILRSLMEKGLIKIMGRKDLPGRPIIYGTTKGFLELFNLNSLSDLPRLKEIQPPAASEEAPNNKITLGAEDTPEGKVTVENEEKVQAEVKTEKSIFAEPESRVTVEAMEEAGSETEVKAQGEVTTEADVRPEVEVKGEEDNKHEAEIEGSASDTDPSFARIVAVGGGS